MVKVEAATRRGLVEKSCACDKTSDRGAPERLSTFLTERTSSSLMAPSWCRWLHHPAVVAGSSLSNCERKPVQQATFEVAEPLSPDDIAEVGRLAGFALPIDYQHFLAEFGGAFVGGLVDGNEDLPILKFYGRRELQDALALHPDMATVPALPIGCCELGNQYVILPDGSVAYVNYYGGQTATTRVSDDFSGFLERMVAEDE